MSPENACPTHQRIVHHPKLRAQDKLRSGGKRLHSPPSLSLPHPCKDPRSVRVQEVGCVVRTSVRTKTISPRSDGHCYQDWPTGEDTGRDGTCQLILRVDCLGTGRTVCDSSDDGQIRLVVTKVVEVTSSGLGTNWPNTFKQRTLASRSPIYGERMSSKILSLDRLVLYK